MQNVLERIKEYHDLAFTGDARLLTPEERVELLRLGGAPVDVHDLIDAAFEFGYMTGRG